MASPTWHSGGTLDTWIELPNSDLNASGVMETGGMEVVDAWGGGVIVTGGLYIGSVQTAGTFLVIFGGGHTNYSGNEVYAYGPLENDSPVWQKLRAATSPAPTNVDEDGSGNPVSRHTYDALVYVDDGTRNWMMCMGILYSYSASNGYNSVHRFDFDVASPASNLPWAKRADAYGAANITAYEPLSGRVWYYVSGANHVGYFDVAANTKTDALYKSPVGAGGNTASDIDTSRGLWAWWSSSGGISFYRTNNGVSNDYYVPTTTGTAPSGQGSILYDSVADVFRVRLDADGKKIWTLTPPASNPYAGGNAWTWSSATPGTGATPDTGNAQGTFGRFGYSPNADVKGYVLMNNPDGKIYFYKSAASVGGSTPKFRASLLGVGM